MRPPAGGDPLLDLGRRPLPRPGSGELPEPADQPDPSLDQRPAQTPGLLLAPPPGQHLLEQRRSRRERGIPICRDERQPAPSIPHPAPRQSHQMHHLVTQRNRIRGNILASAATGRRERLQRRRVTCLPRCPGRPGRKLKPLRLRDHAFRGMLHQMQFCLFSQSCENVCRSWCGCRSGSPTAAPRSLII